MKTKSQEEKEEYEEFIALYCNMPAYEQKVFARAIHALADENRNKVPGRPFGNQFMKIPKGDIQVLVALMDRMGIPKSFLDPRTA